MRWTENAAVWVGCSTPFRICLITGILFHVMTARPARAETRVYEVREDEPAEGRFDFGFDGEGAAMVAPPRSVIGNTLTGGTGFKLRAGDQIQFHRLRFTPEIGYGYQHLFASDDFGNAYSWETHRLFGGARLAFGRIITPGVYGHLGYGWRDTDDPTVPQAGGLELDAGFALDFHLIPHFSFGGHAEYVTIATQPYTPQWLALGLHGDVVF
jgi:hypothetical protein